MIHKMPSRKPGYVTVVFELPACIWADRIFLVGDFNDWQTHVTPFIQGRDGVWRAVLELPAGRQYQFRYLVDGEWQTDYHADGWVENPYGSVNSVVDTTMPVDETVVATGSGAICEESQGLQNGRRRPTASLRPLPLTEAARRQLEETEAQAG